MKNLTKLIKENVAQQGLYAGDYHGNSISMVIPWKTSHGMGWDGTAHICISHEIVAMT